MSYTKLLWALGLAVVSLVMTAGTVVAYCWPGYVVGPDFTPPWNDFCNYHDDGTVDGGTYFSCALYWDQVSYHKCWDANGEVVEGGCKTYQEGCYFQAFSCDSTSCSGFTPSGGGGGIACTRHWDCATGCCQGGYCSSSCTPPPARCNEGETFVAFGPPPQIGCASPGACEMGSDGVTGGYAGEVLWDNTCSGGTKNECLLGSCVPNAPSCKATAPAITKIEPGADPATQAKITWLNGRDGGTSTLLRVDEDVEEVSLGCPTPGDCELATSLPAYSQPADPASAQVMYYYKESANYGNGGCVPSAAYSSIDACEANVDLYVGSDSPGICYLSEAACNTWSKQSYIVSNLLPSKMYSMRVVNYKDSACYDSTIASYTTYPPACVASAPSIVGLSLPLNEATINALSTTLTWSPPASWGVKRPAPNVNRYDVYLQVCAAALVFM